MAAGAYPQPRYLPAGDRALVVELGDAIDPEVNRRVHDLAQALERGGLPGLDEMVPTYRSLLVYYDPARTDMEGLVQGIEGLRRDLGRVELARPRVVLLPTLYGDEFGPDLDFVAQHNGLTPQEVVEIHSGTDYLVYMLGFSPGFPYLGGMSERIATPRLSSPRVEIPAGSVGIAEAQTGVYPVASPGGWRIIGRTPLRLFDPQAEPPSLLRPGDYVRFVPLASRQEYDAILQRVERGEYQPETEEAS